MGKTMNLSSTDEVVHALIKEKESLEQIRTTIERRITNAPQGALRISHSNGCTQYYHRTTAQDSAGKYIRKKDIDMARMLAQKEYDTRINCEISQQIDKISAFLNSYNPQNIVDIYDGLNSDRKALVEAVILPDDEYIKQWKAVDYPGMGFGDEAMELYNDAGERVRSKSEVIISNELLKMGIAYRYEYPVRLISGRIVHPDFYCLNLRKREEIIYEHFGMMDDPEYANKAIKKMEEYQRNGYWLGKNFIATFESARKAVNPHEVKELARQYLL